MMKITVLPDIPYGDTVSITNEIIDVLAPTDTQLLLPPDTARYIGCKERVHFAPYTSIIQECDLIIVVGGDGTVTKYASDAACNNKPVLAINGGHLGFLSGLEKSEISLLSHLMDGQYRIKKRMLLKAEVRDSSGTVIASELCINDAIVGRAGSLRMVDIGVHLDGKFLAKHRADGIIVATPTGSTAYSMSAGGPVVDPHMECIIITPVCSHSLTARSVVCNSQSEIVIKNCSEKNDIRQLYLTTDSKAPVSVPYDGSVVIRKANISVEFITIKKQSFYEILQEKMIERNIGRG
ncbi:MAG: NAD(+)/NADH kinase [Ruminococcaceae bacterium]|nr:NAD(+)/NADH kinase [Oscillospiraceae bacterium]